MRKEFSEDLEAMEEVMARTADRGDIWQDRLIYAMAKAIYHILTYIVRRERRG